MTFPQVPLVNPWSHGEEVDEVDLYDRVTDKLNKLAMSISLGQYGSNYDATATTLALTGGTAYYPLNGPVVVTFAAQRRVQAFARINVNSGATVGKYALHIAYYPGASTPAQGTAGIVTLTSYPVFANNAGASGGFGIVNVGDALMPPGTYTFFGYAVRYSGGAATDAVVGSYLAVNDMGAV